MFKYLNKISSITLAFVFMLSFVGASLLSPQKASAAISNGELQAKAQKIQKLELFKKCVDAVLTVSFAKTTSPFESGRFKVGHLVDSDDG